MPLGIFSALCTHLRDKNLLGHLLADRDRVRAVGHNLRLDDRDELVALADRGVLVGCNKTTREESGGVSEAHGKEPSACNGRVCTSRAESRRA